MSEYAQTSHSWTWKDKTNPPQPTGTFSAFFCSTMMWIDLAVHKNYRSVLYYLTLSPLSASLKQELLVHAARHTCGRGLWERGREFQHLNTTVEALHITKSITMLNKLYRDFFLTIANQLQACARASEIHVLLIWGPWWWSLQGWTARVNSTNWLSQLDLAKGKQH